MSCIPSISQHEDADEEDEDGASHGDPHNDQNGKVCWWRNEIDEKRRRDYFG
jgi:hypothetical protein